MVLAVGRDGIMLPIRHEKHYKEGGVATLSVYDYRRQEGVWERCTWPMQMLCPCRGNCSARGADCGFCCSVSLSGVGGSLAAAGVPDRRGLSSDELLRGSAEPDGEPACRGSQRLQWLWIIDYYHAASYVSKLAQAASSARKRRGRHGHAGCGTSCGTRPEESDGCFSRRRSSYYGMKPRLRRARSESVQRSVRLSAESITRR